MKAMKRILTLAALSAFTANAFAADPPAETQPARRDPIKMQLFRFDAGRHAKMEKAAFLGIATSPAAAALTDQLKLHKGVGLVVDFVEPKSPGDEAGLKQYDVLQKLNDQLLIDSHQFAVLVRTFKPGEEVSLTVIHQGESRSVKVKLIEREVAALDEQHPLDALLSRPITPAMPPLPPNAPIPPAPSNISFLNGIVGSDQPSFERWVDGKGTLSWTRDARTGTIIIQQTDKDGKRSAHIVQNEDQFRALPPDLRDRLEKMQLVVREHRPMTAIGGSGGASSSPATQPATIETRPETH